MESGYRCGQRSAPRRRATELLEQVGLGDRMGHHPGQLSGGQQQRVAIARALVNQPAILMADEPTGNLDSRTSKEIIETLRELNAASGITIILVTHDQDVARHAKRWLVLHDGEIVKDTNDFQQARRCLHSADGDRQEDEDEDEDEEERDRKNSLLPLG
jgi:ABC-type lipoprotein export system ATPase subunit